MLEPSSIQCLWAQNHQSIPFGSVYIRISYILEIAAGQCGFYLYTDTTFFFSPKNIFFFYLNNICAFIENKHFYVIKKKKYIYVCSFPSVIPASSMPWCLVKFTPCLKKRKKHQKNLFVRLLWVIHGMGCLMICRGSAQICKEMFIVYIGASVRRGQRPINIYVYFLFSPVSFLLWLIVHFMITIWMCGCLLFVSFKLDWNQLQNFPWCF